MAHTIDTPEGPPSPSLGPLAERLTVRRRLRLDARGRLEMID